MSITMVVIYIHHEVLGSPAEKIYSINNLPTACL
jgi:hypothetical protein